LVADSECFKVRKKEECDKQHNQNSEEHNNLVTCLSRSSDSTIVPQNFGWFRRFLSNKDFPQQFIRLRLD
jgi:hypothetical protein